MPFGFTPTHPVQVMAEAFNALTVQQTWAAERLSQHVGKTIRIIASGFQANWSIRSDGTLVHIEQVQAPDVTLEILIEKLNPVVWLDPTQRPDLAEYVHVSGQATLVQVISELARDLRPDPEDALSKWVGDIAARRIVGGLKQTARSARLFGAGLAKNIAEYLSEETDMLVGRPAMTTQQTRQARMLTSLVRLEHQQTQLQARLQKIERARGASQ